MSRRCSGEQAKAADASPRWEEDALGFLIAPVDSARSSSTAITSARR